VANIVVDIIVNLVGAIKTAFLRGDGVPVKLKLTIGIKGGGYPVGQLPVADKYPQLGCAANTYIANNRLRRIGYRMHIPVDL